MSSANIDQNEANIMRTDHASARREEEALGPMEPMEATELREYLTADAYHRGRADALREAADRVRALRRVSPRRDDIEHEHIEVTDVLAILEGPQP